MEFQQLRHLISAVEHQNLAKAAEDCNISQSGLSRSISSLEARLGVPLLVRSPRGVEATPFGKVILERARIIISEVQRASDEVRAMAGGRVGAINFGITQNFALYSLHSIVAEMLTERPNLQFNIVTGGFMEMIQQVRNGTIDFAFGLLANVPPMEDLKIEVLRDHYSRVIARASHPLSGVKDVSLQQLVGERWVTLNGAGFQRNFIAYFSQQMSDPLQVLKTDSIGLIKHIVLETDVLTVLPADTVKDELANGSLVIIDCEAPAEATLVCLVYRRDGIQTPQMKLMFDRLRSEFAVQSAS